MKHRSWFSRMERQFPKLEPVTIRVTWIDGETTYIKCEMPVEPSEPPRASDVPSPEPSSTAERTKSLPPAQPPRSGQ